MARVVQSSAGRDTNIVEDFSPFSLSTRVLEGDIVEEDYPVLTAHFASLFSSGRNREAYRLIALLKKRRGGQTPHFSRDSFKDAFIERAKEASEKKNHGLAVHLLSSISPGGISRVPVSDLLQMAARSENHLPQYAKFLSFLAPHKPRLPEIGLTQAKLLDKVRDAINSREYEAARDLLAAAAPAKIRREKLSEIRQLVFSVENQSEVRDLREKIDRLFEVLERKTGSSKK